MSEALAVTIVVIAIASAGSHRDAHVAHATGYPRPWSPHRRAICRYHDGDWCPLSCLLRFFLASSLWKFSSPRPDAKIKRFPGGAAGLVEIAAFLLVGTEVLALGVFGVKAWAGVYFTPPAANALPVQVQAGQFAFYFRYPGPDGKFGPLHS